MQTAPPACGPGSSPVCALAPQGLQPDAKALAVNEWNFTIEQQIAKGTSLRVAYVGSFATHGLLSVDPNTIAPQICGAATCVSGGTPGTTKGSVTMGQQYIPVTTRPNPNLGAGFFWYTEGNSRYNALQTDLVHRMSHGLDIRANYTWSKNLDLNSGLTGAQSSNQAQMIMDPFDLGRDWGPSALNVSQQMSISLGYQLPFGHGQPMFSGAHGIGQQLIGGWQVNSIITALSGFPFTPQDGSNRSGDGDTRNPDRPNVNPAFSGPVVTGNPNQWFNPNAFLLPTAGTWGNLGRGVYSGPGLDLCRYLAVQEYCGHRADASAVPRGGVQFAEPRQLCDSECHRVLGYRSEPDRRPGHGDGDDVAADSVWPETDLLMRHATNTSEFRRQLPRRV